MQKQVIALLGIDTLIGKCFDLAYDPFYRSTFGYSSGTIEWDKPSKALTKITKGNPDTYVICYSALDNAEGRLLEILKVVKRAAHRNKAKIIAFVTEEMFKGCASEVIDEGVKPYAVSDKGRAEILFEERLLSYPNSLIFRIGRLWGENFGLVYSYLRRMISPEGLEVLEDEVFSLTSSELIREGVKAAIENDYVFYYNLVDAKEVSAKNLAEHISEEIIRLKLPSTRRRYISGGERLVLDGQRWATVSMTEPPHWRTLVKRKLPEIVERLNAD